MNNYEHTIILDKILQYLKLNKLKKSIQSILKNKGNIVQTQDWGLMNLSYLIKKKKKEIIFILK